ncbi:flagellar basal body rod protein FlgB [Sandaracinobacteroides hominis]|uniref:flagellar basal body rod protein FlgB n=1 Tax=Sandaracinobacteroides hominis TaxID=2780086 RepID=UPI0018F7553A|nr:flagellar basal body rod protein FlgB [Sandaracinobacteroides hominis]
MDRLDRFLGVHRDALLLRNDRLAVLASNIANAATPGYKARDLDFGSVLSERQPDTLARTNPAHLSANRAASTELLYRKPVQPSLDGNTVELATEQLQFAETALRYRSTLSILNGRLTTLSSALKGE